MAQSGTDERAASTRTDLRDAEALGTSVNAVEIQLRRALKQLAEELPDYVRE